MRKTGIMLGTGAAVLLLGAAMLILGYASLSPEEICEGVDLLKKAWL